MKKIVTLLLIAALSAGTAAAAAADARDAVLISENGNGIPDAAPRFVASTVGAVKTYEENGTKYASAVDSNDMEIRFIISEDTVIINEQGEKAEIEDGAQLTAYIPADAPAPLVLPPIYYPAVIVIDSDAELISNADVYEKDGEVYTNAAKTLSVTTEETKITDADGNAYEGELDGKAIVAIYGITTKSIPPIANPAHIVVLDDVKEEAPVTKIAVGDKTFDIVEKNGTDMVAVRAVSEALSLEVKWDNDLQAVTVGTVQMGVNFVVGENSYKKAKMKAFTLEAAPYLEMTADGGVTYVPVSFFTEVLGCEAEAADGVMTLAF